MISKSDFTFGHLCYLKYLKHYNKTQSGNYLINNYHGTYSSASSINGKAEFFLKDMGGESTEWFLIAGEILAISSVPKQMNLFFNLHKYFFRTHYSNLEEWRDSWNYASLDIYNARIFVPPTVDSYTY